MAWIVVLGILAHVATALQSSLCATSSAFSPPGCHANRRLATWSRAIVRLNAGGHVCTGWFVGSEGHILTAHHCIHKARAVEVVVEETPAQTCPPRTIRGRMTTGIDVVAFSVALDYALLRPLNRSVRGPVHLQLHSSAADIVGLEAIVAQHVDASSPVVLSEAGRIVSTTFAGCGRRDRLAYALDTKASASGSPILSTATGAVLGLHTCGGIHCHGKSVPMWIVIGCSSEPGHWNSGAVAADVVADLRQRHHLPPDAVAHETLSAPTPSTIIVERGRLVQRAANTTSVDAYLLTMAMPGRVTLDLLAWTMDAQGRWHDLRRDCDGSFFDTKVILAVVDDADGRPLLRRIAENDNDTRHQGMGDGSIDNRDAFLDVYLASPGDYYVLVGTAAMLLPAVFAPRLSAPTDGGQHLYGCGNTRATEANYNLRITTDDGTLQRIEAPFPRTAACSSSARKCPAAHADTALTLDAVVAGTLHRTYSSGTSMDHISFELTKAGRIAIDVVSYQEHTNGSIAIDGLHDVCGRAYLDTVLYVFGATIPSGEYLDPAALVATASDRPPTHVASQRYRSVSTRDPYVEVDLPAGNFTLVVGQQPLSLFEAVRVLYPGSRETDAPLLCGRPHPFGHYHVFFWVQHRRMLSATMPGSFDHAACTHEVCSDSML
uniref:Secreted protein n=1 Tax=Achlya hypogyna TaxID=1202772 RepID=A0A0A7CN25_ACHHY|nr:secreted protein [Achlya hypogyna]